VDFFSRFDWWRTEPHDELVDPPNYCLALPDRIYVVYFPRGGRTGIRLQPGHYAGVWFEATTGKTTAVPPFEAGTGTSVMAPGQNDWALLLENQDDPPKPDSLRQIN
jgi:hypothetical protein